MDSKEMEIRNNIKRESRPWGNFKQFAYNQTCTVKIITVSSGQVLSKQRHKNRDELWVILDSGLQVELDEMTINPEPGDEIIILKNTKHRLLSQGKEGRVLEVSFGYFDENDIERFDDIYGRC